ncbi:MAG: XdhC family protein [Desulfovibrio sp.]|jgi:xanthine dehydrogenase accessory factor|nr:XdhC family protein [Desulfovibrio sp.]
METVYGSLLQNLENGRDAVLVTHCRPDGISKNVYAGEDIGEWAGKTDKDTALYIERQDGALTLGEYFSPKPRLIILGAGHIAMPLAEIGAMLDFEVVVFDDRASFANTARFPKASRVVCDYFDLMPQRLAIRRSDYVAIVTRGHKYDQDCLRAILQEKIPYYIGMIGSKRRVVIVRRQLLEEGHAPEVLERVHSPIGLAIGAVTPEEIAVSILAEMIQERRKDSRQRQGRFTDMALLEWLARNAGDRAAIVTVLSTKGSTPREAGAKMAVLDDGRIVGSIGGGCAEAGVLRDARRILNNGGYCCKTIDMTDSAEEDGMVCGGMMEVLIEAYA